MKKSVKVYIAVSLALLLLIVAVQSNHKKSINEDTTTGSGKFSSRQTTAAPVAATANGCDESLWSHVYNPSRLQVITRCVSVTGIIDESSRNDDGDAHFGLKVDSPYSSMVNKMNKSSQNGALVVESVCNQSPSLNKVGNACNGFQSNVYIPKVGDRVKILGAYVLDGHNGWTEIHPATSIAKL